MTTLNPNQDLRIEKLKKLALKIEETVIPPELRVRIEGRLQELENMVGVSGYEAFYNSILRYIDWVCNLPWDVRSEDNLDLPKAREVLDSTHHGLEDVKERILEHIAVLRLQKEGLKTEGAQKLKKELGLKGESLSPVLLFVGLPGIGKTSIAYSIAEALNRQFIRIAMGGMGDALQLRGASRVHPEAEPGLVIRGLRRVGTKNPVLLLDEIDRIAEEERSQIMGVLLELLDPEQNFAFVDYYMDYAFDLSEVMFICSANNTGGISNAVLDRMEIIQMPGYTDEDKIIIARDFLLPRQIKIVGLPEEVVTIEEGVWPKIVRPLGYDAGIRTMERTINTVVRRCAKKFVLGKQEKFHITLENIKEYLPK